MTTDDFENPDSSPLPPYDRNWRHPAEVADTERSRHLGASPPLGRRLTALTVIASVLTSLAVLTVAIPKGIEGYTAAQDEDVVATSTTVPVKGSGKASIAVLRGAHGATSALSLGNREWLVSTEAITVRNSSTSFGTSFSVVRENKDVGLSVIRMNTGSNIPAFSWEKVVSQLTTEDLQDCHIIDAFQVHTLASEPSLSSRQLNDTHPVNMETSIKGIAVALNNAGEVLGVLVRKGHAQWAVSRDALLTLAAR